MEKFIKKFNKIYGNYAKASSFNNGNHIKIECYNNGEILIFPFFPIVRVNHQPEKAIYIPTFSLNNLPINSDIEIKFPFYSFLFKDEMVHFYSVVDIPLEMFYWIPQFSISVMEINSPNITLSIVNNHDSDMPCFYIGNFLLKCDLKRKFLDSDGLPDYHKICEEVCKLENFDKIHQSEKHFKELYELISENMLEK